MDPITLAMLGAGLGKIIWGGVQEARGAAMQKRNQRPVYHIPDEYYQNLGTYEQQAQQGLPASDLDRMHQEALRGLSSSLSTGLQLGAGANTVNDYYRDYLNKMGDIGLKNSLARFNNINQLAGARESLANQKFIQFGYNEDAPYKDRAQLATLEKTQGIENIAGGVDTGIAGVAGQQARDLYRTEIEQNNRITNNVDPTLEDNRTTYIPSTGLIHPVTPTINSTTDLTPRMVTRQTAQLGLPSSPNENSYYWRRLANSWWMQPGETK